jgi:hypothetical protein
VKPLYREAGSFPILHGSSIFNRGDTQVRTRTCMFALCFDGVRLRYLIFEMTKRKPKF